MLGDDAPDDRVWVAAPSTDGAWLPAKVVARHADQTVTVRSDDGAVELTQKAEVRVRPRPAPAPACRRSSAPPLRARARPGG